MSYDNVCWINQWLIGVFTWRTIKKPRKSQCGTNELEMGI